MKLYVASSWRNPLQPARPVRHSFALVGLGICLGIVAFALVLTIARQLDGSSIAAPSPAPHPTIGLPRDLSGLLADASDARQGGAPHIPGPRPDRDRAVAGHDGAPRPPKERPVPVSSGGIGTALLGGWAAFCDPTPDRCQSWAMPALLGAMPGYAFEDEPFAARVCTDGSQCIVVIVVSYCACGDRHGLPTVIDLSPAAMEAIEPDYRRLGIVRVTVEFPVQGPSLPDDPD